MKTIRFSNIRQKVHSRRRILSMMKELEMKPPMPAVVVQVFVFVMLVMVFLVVQLDALQA
jgi:hypothetical protein